MATSGRIIGHGEYGAVSKGRMKFWGWGYEGDGLTSDERERLLSFYHHRFGIDAGDQPPPAVDEIDLAPSRLKAPAALASICSIEPYDRLLHSYGKSYPDAVNVFARDFSHAPDLVAKPESEAEVQALLDWVGDRNAAVIPFGGGSSVVGGIEPLVGSSFDGTISLDLGGLNALLEIDKTSRAARFQAGILGPDLEAALKPHGLTLRHFPQSFEVSTLGGWIATRSGGHFATLYTHIDDLVESTRSVTPAGIVESRRLPGSGAGPSPDRLMIGAEGALGVITEAWIRVQDRPTHKAGAAIGFADFKQGAEAIRAVAQAGLYPSNLRLIDADEALVNGVNDGSEALMVLAFESADHPVHGWMARALELVQDHGGRLHADTAAAERWRTAFIRMPYNREIVTPQNIINDTFETAITWDGFPAFHDRVKSATEQAIRDATGVDGLVTCRFTHVYPDGPAPYFTFHAKGREGVLLEQWRTIKSKASDALIEAGGTITHHHAVGRDHMPWYAKQRPSLFGEVLAAAKGVLDPAGIMNPGVIVAPRNA
ncbi:MAG: FAD-binding oxidoreductase [Geminicoccaceae bacterium]